MPALFAAADTNNGGVVSGAEVALPPPPQATSAALARAVAKAVKRLVRWGGGAEEVSLSAFKKLDGRQILFLKPVISMISMLLIIGFLCICSQKPEIKIQI